MLGGDVCNPWSIKHLGQSPSARPAGSSPPHCGQVCMETFINILSSSEFCTYQYRITSRTLQDAKINSQ
jgi:hypothetical protein